MKKVTKKTVSKNASQKAGSGRGILNRYIYDLYTDDRISPKEWENDVQEYFKGKCVYCGCTVKKGKNLQRDHAIPLTQEHLGLSIRGNIVPACKTCNSKKGARHYVDFCCGKDGPKADQGKAAEKTITKYMEEKNYKELGKNEAERDKIRKIISNALEQIAKIRDEAVARIEKIVNKKPTKKQRRRNLQPKK